MQLFCPFCGSSQMWEVVCGKCGHGPGSGVDGTLSGLCHGHKGNPITPTGWQKCGRSPAASTDTTFCKLAVCASAALASPSPFCPVGRFVSSTATRHENSKKNATVCDAVPPRGRTGKLALVGFARGGHLARGRRVSVQMFQDRIRSIRPLTTRASEGSLVLLAEIAQVAQH
jgi:hypothetical protein